MSLATTIMFPLKYTINNNFQKGTYIVQESTPVLTCESRFRTTSLTFLTWNEQNNKSNLFFKGAGKVDKDHVTLIPRGRYPFREHQESWYLVEIERWAIIDRSNYSLHTPSRTVMALECICTIKPEPRFFGFLTACIYQVTHCLGQPLIKMCVIKSYYL